MQQADFPIRVRMNESALYELHGCEYGSYEDHIKYDGTREGEYADGKLHCVELIDRGGHKGHKTVVILETQDELDEFFCAAMTGTWGMFCPRVAFRVFDELYDFVSENRKVNISRGSIGH